MNQGRPRSSSSGETTTTPFPAFWIAAFDGTDHLVPLDDVAYRRRVVADYRGVRDIGVECVHESVGWRRVERDGRFDFASVLMRAEAAMREGLRIVWTLCDAGWPDDVDVAAADFPTRLRRFATAAARALAPYARNDAPVYMPINEISFLSWALADTSLFGPPLHGGADSIKRQLVRAALAACDAIRDVEPHARFLHREAAVPPTPPDVASLNVRFDAWDMLAGRLAPELGGDPRYLDIVGVHCHWTQQWRSAAIANPTADPLRLDNAVLAELLEDVYARYRRPIVVSETNRIATGRAQWLRELGGAIGAALGSGVPVIGAGVCRIVERPSWEDPRYWRERRLWDALLDTRGAAPRTHDSAYEQALRDVRARIDPLVERSQDRYPS